MNCSGDDFLNFNMLSHQVVIDAFTRTGVLVAVTDSRSAFHGW